MSVMFLRSHRHQAGSHLAGGHRGTHPTHTHPSVGEGEWLAQPAISLLVVSIEIQSEAQALQVLIMAAGQLK